MPTGTGAINTKNIPTVPFKVNPGLFNALTNPQDFPPPAQSIAPPAGFVTFTFPQVGIVGKVRMIVQGLISYTTVATTSSITPTFKWPYGIFNNVQLSGNQMNNFISASGFDLSLRQLVQFKSFKDSVTVPGLSAAHIPGSVGTFTFPFTIQLDVPVAMDMTSLVGALYAQTEATNLTLQLTTESLANLFTLNDGSTVTLLNSAGTANTTPTVSFEESMFSVPYDPSAAGTLVLPDLTVLHGLIADKQVLTGNLSPTVFLSRSNADLHRLYFYVNNGGSLLPSANWVNASIKYAASTEPYRFQPIQFLQTKNQEDVRQALPDGVFVLDQDAENPARDKFILQGLTQLRLEANFTSSTVLAATAELRYVQETLFA